MAVFENFNRQVVPDLTFICSDGQVECHKVVVSSFAPYVKMLLIETDSDVIIAPGFKKVEFLEMLDVCYGVKSEARNETR